MQFSLLKIFKILWFADWRDKTTISRKTDFLFTGNAEY